DSSLRGARPARHLLLERIHERGPVADRKRAERELALLRLTLRVHGGPRARDLTDQSLALETLQARHQLLFDRLCTGEGRVAGRLHGALERRIDAHRRLAQCRVVLLDAVPQRGERRNRFRWELVAPGPRFPLARL